MEKAKRFEGLWIWQQARELVKNIYNVFFQARMDTRIMDLKIRSKEPGYQS